MVERARGGVGARGVFAALALLFVLTLLFTPARGGREGDARLTTHAASPQGARGLYEIARRLGWRAAQRETPFSTSLDSAAVYAVLAPPTPVTAHETGRLLDAVRRGAGLLVVVQPGSALTDSLGLGRSDDGGTLIAAPPPSCPDSTRRKGAIDWPDGDVHSWWLTGRARSIPGDAVRFAVVRREVAGGAPVELPAAIGLPFGRGRIVAVADPDLLRNDVLRVCQWGAGVAAVRMLEWLGEGGQDPREAGELPPRRREAGERPPRRIIFDEYHQGFGTHGNPVRAVRHALTGTPAGRAALQALAAALVLLLALGVRPIAPRPRRRIERRSPLEHVGALARAYEQVGATRTATRRLVRGLRRRHAHGASRGASDAEFLRAVAERHPTTAPSVALLLDASERRLTPAELLRAGEAVAQIERTISPISPATPT